MFKRKSGCHDVSKNQSIPDLWIMSQSIPTGYMPPPGNPFFEERCPATREIFLSNSLPPGQKKYGRIPGGRAKFSQSRRSCSLSLQEIFKKLRTLRDSTNFLFGELNKPLYFRLKQNHSKVFDPIQAGVFWNNIGWGALCPPPSVSPLFVVQLQPSLA